MLARMFKAEKLASAFSSVIRIELNYTYSTSSIKVAKKEDRRFSRALLDT
jgi:hypothetical protein